MANPPSLVLLLLIYGKDILGLIGSILTVIPFFKEWRLKGKMQQAASPIGIEGEFTLAAFEAITERFRKQLFVADKKDFMLISVGLVLISLSFLFSLIITHLS